MRAERVSATGMGDGLEPLDTSGERRPGLGKAKVLTGRLVIGSRT